MHTAPEVKKCSSHGLCGCCAYYGPDSVQLSENYSDYDITDIVVKYRVFDLPGNLIGSNFLTCSLQLL